MDVILARMLGSSRLLGVPLRAVALFGLAFSIAWGWSILDARPGLTWEFVEYADTAREIARGQGFSTHVSLASSLAYYDDAGISPSGGTAPQLTRHPGFACSLAAFFAVLGPGDGSMLLALWCFFAAWIAGSYLLLRPLLGERVSLATALLLAVNPVFARYFVAGGYAAFLFGLSALAFLVFSVRLLCADGPPPWRRFGLLGLLAAWCWLLRFNFSLFVVLFVLLALLSLPRGRPTALALAAFITAFVLGTLPFRVWQAVTFGTTQSPATWWNLLDGLTGGRPWMQYRTWGPADLLSDARISRLLLRKLPHLGQLTLRQLPDLFHYTALMPLFFVSLLRQPEGREARLLLRFGTAALVAMAVVLAAFRYELWFFDDPIGLLQLSARYFVWFAPLAVGFALWALFSLVQERPVWVRSAILVGVVLAQVAILAPYFSPSNRLYPGMAGGMAEEPIVAVLEELQAGGVLPVEELLSSNAAAHLAWYLDRATTAFPERLDELRPILEKHPLAGFHFTHATIGEPHNLGQWRDLLADPRRADAWFAEIGMAPVFRDERDVIYLPVARAEAFLERRSR